MEQNAHKVKVIGHKNPDTDSICAAIAYAALKNKVDTAHRYEACRAGLVNRESQFALDYFGVKPPRLTTDVSPQLQDVDYRRDAGVDASLSLRRAWDLLGERNADTLCVVDGENILKGLVTIKDMTTAYMDMIDEEILAKAETPYENLVDTLDAAVLAGTVEGKVVTGNIVVGAGSGSMMEASITKGDVVIVSDRAESQLAAIEGEAGCIVVCQGAKVSKTICSLAEEHGCILLSTPHSTYVAGQMAVQAAPIGHYMVSRNLLTFSPHSPVENVTKIMASVRYRYFPILDESGHYLGMVSRRNLLNLEKKRIILVDHNEKSQAVDGLDESEILEIIDHHRIGAVETEGPVYFRNMPVGATCTIVYLLYRENGVTPQRAEAGLMLSAILSDTLMFRSPTCTPLDEQAARELAKLAEVDMESYAQAMFDHGGDVSGKSPEELLRTDYKIFTGGGTRFGVGQSIFMSDKNRSAGEELLRPYLDTALRKQGVDFLFYMFTDVPTSTTELMMAGEGAEELVKRAFDVETHDRLAVLPGVMSRKKQMIPALLSAIKAEQP